MLRDASLPSSPVSGGFNSGLIKPYSQALLLFCSPSQPAQYSSDVHGPHHRLQAEICNFLQGKFNPHGSPVTHYPDSKDEPTPALSPGAASLLWKAAEV